MVTLQTYATRMEAEIARIALEGAGIAAVVVGVGVAMEGGIAGVRLLVPTEEVERALDVLAGR